MNRLTENKIVLVVRATRLADLKVRFATKMQAQFYVSRLGGDFADYEKEDTTYQTAIAEARQDGRARRDFQRRHRAGFSGAQLRHAGSDQHCGTERPAGGVKPISYLFSP